MRTRAPAAVAALWLVGALGGCASQRPPALLPAPSANAVFTDPGAATASAAGVRMEVDGLAWSGPREELGGVLPVQLTVENHGTQPLRLQYRDFALVGPDGTRLAALPPLHLEGDDARTARQVAGGPVHPPVTPGYRADRRFLPALPYGSALKVERTWPGPFSLDPTYYGTQFVRWPTRLPTPDMIARGIPEGVLEPGGSLSGFLYFRDLPERLDQVRFEARLVDANSGAQLGRIDVPLVAGGS